MTRVESRGGELVPTPRVVGVLEMIPWGMLRVGRGWEGCDFTATFCCCMHEHIHERAILRAKRHTLRKAETATEVFK